MSETDPKTASSSSLDGVAAHQERMTPDTPLRRQRLASRIEKLAQKLESSPRPQKMDKQMLSQLDELRALLFEQRNELSEQAAEANAMLQQCQNEIRQTEQLNEKLDRMRRQQQTDRQRDRESRNRVA